MAGGGKCCPHCDPDVKLYIYINQCSHLLQVTLVLFWLGWGVLGWNGDPHRWCAEAALRRSYCVWCGSELATPVRLQWLWFSSWCGKESHCLWLTNSTRSSLRRWGNMARSPTVGVPWMKSKWSQGLSSLSTLRKAWSLVGRKTAEPTFLHL